MAEERGPHKVVDSRNLIALLVVNRRFVVTDGGIWTEGAIGPETGERYLRWFDRLLVAGRRGDLAKGETASLNRVEARGLQVKFLPDISGMRKMVRNRAAARRELLSLLGQVDCVVARVSDLGLLAAKVALDIGKPLAIDVGGCPFDGLRTHGSRLALAYAPVAFLQTRAIIRRVGWVSYVTEKFLQRRYPAQEGAVTVACSNVEIPDPSANTLAERLRRIQSHRKPLRFGTIGSLHGRFKGIQHAIPALAKVAHCLPAFEYRVLGGGDSEPWREIAENYGLADRVFFDGTLPSGTPVYDWLDKLDVYLHPSLREGLPRAVVEALSRACPVIASDVAGTPELLSNEDMHPPGDIDRLARLIAQTPNQNWQLSAARRNWDKSKDFSHSVLMKKRNEFWGGFAKAVAAGKV